MSCGWLAAVSARPSRRSRAQMSTQQCRLSRLSRPSCRRMACSPPSRPGSRVSAPATPPAPDNSVTQPPRLARALGGDPDGLAAEPHFEAPERDDLDGPGPRLDL